MENVPEKATNDGRDFRELMQAQDLLRLVAYRRDSRVLHEIAGMVQRFLVATFSEEQAPKSHDEHALDALERVRRHAEASTAKRELSAHVVAEAIDLARRCGWTAEELRGLGVAL